MKCWRPLAALVLVGLAASLVPADAATTYPVYAGSYQVAVGSDVATGYLAYPTSTAATTMLVFGHGCCGHPDQTAFVSDYASRYGVVVVAMDYRGPGHWDVSKGAEDLVAATIDLKARFGITRTVLWGASMGGEVTGMAAARHPELFDYWVSLFGVSDLYQEFGTLGSYPQMVITGNTADPTGSWIAEECGGTPLTASQSYAQRSPALLGSQMRGLRHAYLVHGLGDLLVPYSESREMYAALLAAGVPSSMSTVLTGGGGTSAWVPGNGMYTLPLPYGMAGHDGRTLPFATAIVGALLAGGEPDAGIPAIEHVYDETTHTHVFVP